MNIDAQFGRFDAILAESLDRLSRDLEEIAHLYKSLSYAGIKLMTLSEGEINDLHVGLKGTMGALYLKDLGDKTRRGLRGRVEKGLSGGGKSYGYRVLKKPCADGTTEPGHREIIAEQAEIVCRIFRDYANGLSPRKIAQIKDLLAMSFERCERSRLVLTIRSLCSGVLTVTKFMVGRCTASAIASASR